MLRLFDEEGGGMGGRQEKSGKGRRRKGEGRKWTGKRSRLKVLGTGFYLVQPPM